MIEEVIGRPADFVLLFGSGIIKKPILKAYQDRVINLHLGLSPYCRGSRTNFWPLVDGKPECVGETTHLAVLKVDAGKILHQVRPHGLSFDDTVHDVGKKTIRSALRVLPKAIKGYFNDKIKLINQPNFDDQDFRRMDLNAESIAQADHNFEQGMLKRYLENKNERDLVYPIVDATLI